MVTIPPHPADGSTRPTLHFADEQITLYHGDSLEVLRSLPDASVDCCVTSPPYFGLRDYGVQPTDWPEVLYSPIVGMPPVSVPAMSCALGAEADPAAFIAHLRLIFAEVRRVLVDDGTAWLNLGDSYVSKPPGNVRGVSDATGLHGGRTSDAYRERLAAGHGTKSDTTKFGLAEKNLIGIPWRAAFALQDEGWFLRQENLWAKRSCMPEAVTDRTSRSHEQVFHLTKSPRYWYDADAIREESDPEQVAHNERYAKVYAAQADRAATTGQPGNVNSAGIHSRPGKPGRNARTVWSMATQPFSEAHFAVMPHPLAERCVMAGCKPGGTVLDPFSGSGTTGLAATKHGRKYVGIDLNADYLDLSLRTRFADKGLDFGEASA